jgi:hypothetical protein
MAQAAVMNRTPVRSIKNCARKRQSSSVDEHAEHGEDGDYELVRRQADEHAEVVDLRTPAR